MTETKSKTTVIIYWVSTALLCLLMLASASMYLLNYDDIVQIFEGFGYPGYVVYPLAIAKILGVVAILTKRSRLLKEWAYAGFFFDFLLAFGAHYVAQDGGTITPIIALALLLISRYFDEQLFS